MKKLTLLFAFIVTTITASAHAVLIETDLTGTKGKSHNIKVVYGEPDEHEEVSKWWWYKEGDKVTLTLTKPDGSKQTLSTSVQKDHLLATFTPDQDGVYQVALQHDTERKADAKSQYQINANATVKIGKSTQGNNASNVANALNVYTVQDVMKKNKEVKLALFEHGKPAANAWFQVLSPSGWGKWLETDDNGVASFIPEWTGKYFVEGSKKEKVSGQSFEEYSRAVSYSFEVK